MNNICIYFKHSPERDRFVRGDRFLRPLVRNLMRRKKMGGVEKVFYNLCNSFRQLNVNYTVNLPFEQLKDNDAVIVLGAGKHGLNGYNRANKIIAGIGLMTHPSEWPTLFQDYPVVKYLQHSTWANNVYIPYFGEENCEKWFAGIDTEKWMPENRQNKEIDFLIYNKIRWNKDFYAESLKIPIINMLEQEGLTFCEINYGTYEEIEYQKLLRKSKAMIFLCEHESQGFACCEALSMDIPVFAWDQGFCLDPNRFAWNDPVIPATSVPFFDDRCGLTFRDFKEFEQKFDIFRKRQIENDFKPRQFILENLTLKKSGLRMLDILQEVY